MKADTRRASNDGRSTGFTLVEILVLVCLISLLSVLVLPVMSSARSSGQDAKSVSHLREIGTVLLLYAVDHDGCIPPRIEQIAMPDGTTGSGLAWHSRLLVDGYVKSKDVFLNPKEKYKNWASFSADSSISPSTRNLTSAWHPVYGYRGDNWPGSSRNIFRPRDITHPAEFFIMTESWMVAGGYPGYFVSSDPNWRVKIDSRGKANTLFADGHVEPKTREWFTNLPNTPQEITGGGEYHLWPENL